MLARLASGSSWGTARTRSSWPISVRVSFAGPSMKAMSSWASAAALARTGAAARVKCSSSATATKWASCRIKRSDELPGVDELDSRFLEVGGVAGGQNGAQVPADGRDLSVGDADRPAGPLAIGDDLGVPPAGT